jgi:uncharacterized protein YdiU (UPF0061 family)
VPPSDIYRPDPRHTSLGETFFDVVRPAAFPQAILRFRNDAWASRIGLAALTNEEWIAHFARFDPLPDNLGAPLALRYHGHQFRTYNPDLGDGRGFLFAQLRDEDDRLLDLATKGSGRTPWSRSGDGRLTLKGGVREILATEMLEAQGVYTSKSFSLIETGEALERGDEPSPARSSVLVRLSHSHVRIGTFQRLAAHGETDALRRLADYCIEQYWPEAANTEDPVASLFRLAVEAIARMAADWWIAGFVHGVLNTDNTTITGESFDYGPWRFLPELDPAFTAAYFDHGGLYAFGRQADSLYWNCERLAGCLLELSDEPALIEGLKRFEPTFWQRLVQRTHAKLGLTPDEEASQLTQSFYEAMYQTRLPYERVFFDLIGGAPGARLDASPLREAYDAGPWPSVVAALRSAPPAPELARALSHPYFDRDGPCTLLIDEVEALWAPIAESDDWFPFRSKIEDIRGLGEAYRPLLPVRVR